MTDLRGNSKITIHVHYTDQYGKPVDGVTDVILTGNKGDSYKVEMPETNNPDKYVNPKCSIPLTGTFDTDITAVVTYDNRYVDITVHRLDFDTKQKLLDDATFTGLGKSKAYFDFMNNEAPTEITVSGQKYKLDETESAKVSDQNPDANGHLTFNAMYKKEV
ncbi:hypothetical protein M3M38_07450 [Fructilactobacillus cliffordii]|uniref:hypothetical protein n=1 Tax=Fructilactobacillus cliffordii TaxID=2940299 RepID=UPI00209310B0|nr:hypothetical protein [Fructilactobacillus cliffordii]USS86495.1 hypothetical protein M3M38_07450 [Fructilactobacillus cliffordii]